MTDSKAPRLDFSSTFLYFIFPFSLSKMVNMGICNASHQNFEFQISSSKQEIGFKRFGFFKTDLMSCYCLHMCYISIRFNQILLFC